MSIMDHHQKADDAKRLVRFLVEKATPIYGGQKWGKGWVLAEFRFRCRAVSLPFRFRYRFVREIPPYMDRWFSRIQTHIELSPGSYN